MPKKSDMKKKTHKEQRFMLLVALAYAIVMFALAIKSL